MYCLLLLVIANRLFVWMIGLTLCYVARDYDLSARNSTFVKWDAVYFVKIAECGYQFEDQLAFFPGFPLIVRILSRVSGVSINVIAQVVPSVCYVGCAFVLYCLTLSVGYDRAFAVRTVKFWVISPISIFCFAPYTESMFALLSFSGMLMWIKRRKMLSVVCFVAAGFTRSNGVLLAGFFLYSGFMGFTRIDDRTGKDIYATLFDAVLRIRFRLSAMVTGVVSGVLAVFCCVPSLLFSAYANREMCPGCEWCGSSPYGYVQEKYWNVGFMRFWRVQQLPNIILALPITYFIVLYAWKIPKNTRLIPFVVHLLVLLAFSLVFAHVHVATRLLLAASPAAWWALASMNGRASIVFSVSYLVIGTSLFVNFLPWT